MKGSKGFSLIEAIVILLIINALIAFFVIGGIRFRSALEYSYSIHQIVSDIKLTQQLADTSIQLCRIDFKTGGNRYTITKGGNIFKSGIVGGKVQFQGKDHFSFVQSGYTDVGGSGTLILGGAPVSRKIIVSSRGRIRVE